MTLPWKARKQAARLAELHAKRDDAVARLAATKPRSEARSLAWKRAHDATNAALRAELRG